MDHQLTYSLVLFVLSICIESVLTAYFTLKTRSQYGLNTDSPRTHLEVGANQFFEKTDQIGIYRVIICRLRNG